MAVSKKFGGRPKREPKPGERVQLSFRITPEIKKRLDEAAEHSGRSQSQEAEFRLELSFHREQLLIESMTLLFGRELAGLIYTLGVVMSRVGTVTANRKMLGTTPWMVQPYPYDQAVRAAVSLLEALRPQGDPKLSVDVSAAGLLGESISKDSETQIDRFGENLAKLMIHALLEHPYKGAGFQQDAEKIRCLLGPVLNQLKEPSTDEGQLNPPRQA